MGNTVSGGATVEILELLKDSEVGYFGILSFMTFTLLGIVVEIIRELVINYHKK